MAPSAIRIGENPSLSYRGAKVGNIFDSPNTCPHFFSHRAKFGFSPDEIAADGTNRPRRSLPSMRASPPRTRPARPETACPTAEPQKHGGRAPSIGPRPGPCRKRSMIPQRTPAARTMPETSMTPQRTPAARKSAYTASARNASARNEKREELLGTPLFPIEPSPVIVPCTRLSNTSPHRPCRPYRSSCGLRPQQLPERRPS